MHRRSFTTGLLTTSLASPMILGASQTFASQKDDNDNRDPFEALSRVILILGLQRIIIEFLLIYNPAGLLGLNLKQPQPQFNENRASVGKIPLLGGLFRQPLHKRFDPSTLVAQVFLFHSMLFLVPHQRPVSNVSQVVISHRKISWEPTRRPRRMRMSNLPTIGNLKNTARFLGTAHQADNELLVIVRPSIISVDE